MTDKNPEAAAQAGDRVCRFDAWHAAWYWAWSAETFIFNPPQDAANHREWLEDVFGDHVASHGFLLEEYMAVVKRDDLPMPPLSTWPEDAIHGRRD